MNVIDILGSILRGSPGGRASGGGGRVLEDILGGGAEEEAPARAPSRAAEPAARPAPSSTGSVLDTWRREGETPAAPVRPASPTPSPRWNGGGLLRTPTPPPSANREEDAVHLIRAMICAARADGEMDSEEEQNILKHLGEPSREVVAFIRAEFEKPLDVREFAWSIPLGLEEKVYSLSLAVMKADSRAEHEYLSDLSHGLRLSPDTCRQLHQRYGAPMPS